MPIHPKIKIGRPKARGSTQGGIQRTALSTELKVEAVDVRKKRIDQHTYRGAPG
jgi:hypothetical protein